MGVLEQGTIFGWRAIRVQHFATVETSTQMAHAKTRRFNVLRKDRKLPRWAAIHAERLTAQ